MNKKEDTHILNLISESGMLKFVRRSGWTVLGIKDGETVAEHSFRCCVLGYIIARMEKADPYKAMLMALFNDIHEARISDFHKMSQRYIDSEKIEDKAFYEQIKDLPKAMKDELGNMRKTYRAQKTKESVIARDADILECLIQAKEYYIHGFKEAEKFTKKAPRFLKTKSAIKLWARAKNTDLNKWWESLSEFKR